MGFSIPTKRVCTMRFEPHRTRESHVNPQSANKHVHRPPFENAARYSLPAARRASAKSSRRQASPAGNVSRRSATHCAPEIARSSISHRIQRSDLFRSVRDEIRRKQFLAVGHSVVVRGHERVAKATEAPYAARHHSDTPAVGIGQRENCSGRRHRTQFADGETNVCRNHRSSIANIRFLQRACTPPQENAGRQSYLGGVVKCLSTARPS